jgi:chemotaxis protein histidine kinase CheA
MTFDLTAIIGEFREEADEHIEKMNARLLELERDPTATEAIRAMFLSAHTIKGSAAMLEMSEISTLAHAVEDVLAYLRDERQPLKRQTADLLFTSLDTLRALLGTPVTGDVAPAAAILELSAALRRHATDHVTDNIDGPDAPPNVDNSATAPRNRSDAPGAPSDGRGVPRALLLEDSATVRLLETMQLQEAGFAVDAVADGMKAIQLATAHAYDLIVTGVECEGLRGWDLVAALREVLSSRSMPIIVISSDRDADPRSAADAGLYAYMRKGSWRRRDLQDAARGILAGREDMAGLKGYA